MMIESFLKISILAFCTYSLFLCVSVSASLSHLDFKQINTKNENNALPVVLWHGMGDNCCSKGSMEKIKHVIQKALPGTYVLSLMIGKDPSADSKNSFFMPVDDQIKIVCKQLSEDDKLKDTDINVIGFSQGAQFLRGYVERCNLPKVKNLISIGGQHEGVFGLPNCIGKHSAWCNLSKSIIKMGAYTNYVQNHVVQAQYWHDPLKEKEYVQNSHFLADINNEKSINPSYKENMLKLNKFVMVRFSKDSYVDPRESEVSVRR